MFGSMFGLGMEGNYDSRKVGRYEAETGGLIISTCSVTDSDQPYETAISHKSYNNADWVIAEQYDTKEKAEAGHEAWIKKMTAKELPMELKDISTCEIASLCFDGEGDSRRIRKKDD